MNKTAKQEEPMTDQQLKTAVSEVLLRHFADEANQTFEEYCIVYDRDKHEALLNKIMRPVLKDRTNLAKQKEELEVL